MKTKKQIERMLEEYARQVVIFGDLGHMFNLTDMEGKVEALTWVLAGSDMRYFNVFADIPSCSKVMEYGVISESYPNKFETQEEMARSVSTICEGREILISSIVELSKEDYEEYWRK